MASLFEEIFTLEDRKRWSREVFSRIKGLYQLSNDDDLIKLFNLPVGLPVNSRSRGKIPFELAYLVSLQKGLDISFILTGKEAGKLDKEISEAARKGIMNGILSATQSKLIDPAQALNVDYINSLTDLIMECITREQLKINNSINNEIDEKRA